jgi:PKD repeat protein
MAVKRLTETNGWVDGVVHHKSPNQNGGMAVPSGVMGVVMHTMVGDLPGTDSAFMNPSYLASAHFGIAQDGTIIQWVSIRGGVAWHCMNGNANWYGIEHADHENPSNALTDAQLSASAQLVELLSRDSVGRFPFDITNSPNTEGYGVHNMGGGSWGGHTCPQNADGSGPRAGQRADILARAKTIRATGQYPAPDAGEKPTARVSVTPSAGTAPLTVTADATASVAGSGSLVDYQCGWGDGTGWFKGKATLEHVYTAAGTYDVTMIVFNSSGRQDTAHATVTVTSEKFHGEYTTDGLLSLAQIGAALRHQVATTLRQTAIHYGAFDGGISAYLNGLADGSVNPDDPVSAGARLWMD